MSQMVARAGRWLMRCGAAGLVLVAAQATSAPQSGSAGCANGAPVAAEYCGFFARYNQDGNTAPDFRIADALAPKGGTTRSVALIIAIDHYPHLDGADVSAAAVDRERLKDFLINDQKFDEVIVLKNEEASEHNLRYFLKEYLPAVAKEGYENSRLLIAYSGHGRGSDYDISNAALILSEATPTDSFSNVYTMEEFTRDIKNLSTRYFHVLTLINACQGGDVFRGSESSGGGNPGTTDEPGSYIMTAGSAKDDVPALRPERGSLFFDLIITGMREGIIADDYGDGVRAVGGAGHDLQGADNPLQPTGMASTNTLLQFVTRADIIINRANRKTPKFHKVSPPWFGAAQANGPALGGFFFLSGDKRSSIDSVVEPYFPTLASTGPSHGPTTSVVAAAPGSRRFRPAGLWLAGQGIPGGKLRVPVGPVSSIIGRPDIKIFKAPSVYPVRGYDLSSAEGAIDWKAFAAAPDRPTFIYARAVGWKGIDKRFSDRWSHIGALGIDRGAYLKFDFCRAPIDQLVQFQSVVPPDPSILPVAIELVEPQRRMDSAQAACYARLGAEGSKAAILSLAALIKARYEKTPLIFGNRYNLGILSDGRSDPYMVWLATYGVSSTGSGVLLAGNNPWTLWQYSGSLAVPGLGKKITGDVFFGNRAQYEKFKAGTGNIALEAVR